MPIGASDEEKSEWSYFCRSQAHFFPIFTPSNTKKMGVYVVFYSFFRHFCLVFLFFSIFVTE